MEESIPINVDEDRLAQLGYKQELRRDWSMLHNFGVSFSIIVSTGHLLFWLQGPSMPFALCSEDLIVLDFSLR